MKIQLRCRCGAEATFENDFAPYAMSSSNEWQDRHKDCPPAPVPMATNPVTPLAPITITERDSCDHQWMTDTGGTRCAKCGATP